MKSSVLVCTDLDRTLLPNGPQPESPGARALFSTLMKQDQLQLCYVSGRHLQLVEEAIAEYAVPVPDFILSDVGTCLYYRDKDHWLPDSGWADRIAEDFNGYSCQAIAGLLAGEEVLEMQEAHKQNAFKVGYYLSESSEPTRLLERVEGVLSAHAVRASLIWSVDEQADPARAGLLDIVPRSATKRGGIEYLMQEQAYTLANTVFAGDSGNDLQVISSPVKSVLVANASEQIKAQARALARQAGTEDSLYIATGGVLGMNGNYSAGILEGLMHYLPESRAWLEA